jgi:L-2,4-diaminobutyrate decarboxylase
MLIEKEVIKYLTELAGWNASLSGGIFTFGGKSTNLYALKIALNKAIPNVRKVGIDQEIRIISTDTGHPSHIEACNWLGVGTRSCIRLKTTNGVLSLSDFEAEFESIIRNEQKLPLIYLNGFSTLEHAIDDIKGVYDIRNRLCAKHNLDYTPHIHVDSVIGWVYLFLSQYDFIKNKLNIPSKVLSILEKKYHKIAEISYADSFSADFHKSGFCSYSSSVFMIKDKNDLHEIEYKYQEDESLSFSQYSPYNYSLELSRPSHGPVSAFAAMRTLGAEGFITILARLTESFLCLKDSLESYPHAKVLNFQESSNVIFFIFKPNPTIVIQANMEPALVEIIKEFNTNFYKFLINKLERGETSVFFSCSRSHKFKGQTFGSIKLYSFNSNLTAIKAVGIVSEIIKLFEEYIDNPKVKSTYNIFDFLDVKGTTK